MLADSGAPYAEQSSSAVRALNNNSHTNSANCASVMVDPSHVQIHMEPLIDGTSSRSGSDGRQQTSDTRGGAS